MSFIHSELSVDIVTATPKKNGTEEPTTNVEMISNSGKKGSQNVKENVPLITEPQQCLPLDNNWRRILDEESGIKVANLLESTGLYSLDCSNEEGFSLLHLAASKGFLKLLTELLSRGVDPNIETVQGDTPIFFAVENNHQSCIQELILRCNICHITKLNSSILHSAAKHNNYEVIDVILNMVAQKKILDVNLIDDHGYTAIYYALKGARYDIVQRIIQYCISESIHAKATKEETLLQFYTTRNFKGQFDNAIIRVLELEKELHNSKTNSEKCIRNQLGTTQASNKAKEQLQSLYPSTQIQRHCWIFWTFFSCFLVPLFLYFLDVYTDVALAIEYYNEYERLTLNYTDIETGAPFFYENITQIKINLMWTIFFILFPMAFLILWSLHDVWPLIKKLPKSKRYLIYIIHAIPAFGTILSYIENFYAQVQYMNVTAEISEKPVVSPSMLNLPEDDRVQREQSSASDLVRDHFQLKNVAQMKVAFSNVLEATLESAFQLILQLYILGTQYKGLKDLHLGDLTLGNILSLTPTEDPKSRLSKQAISIFISLVSLTWAFTSYHRFSKLGGLRILRSLPLLFSIFFQIISRAISCAIFTLAFTWVIFIFLGIHLILIFVLKILFERNTEAPKLKNSRFFSKIQPYSYAILGTLTSIFVYFRIQRPLSKKDQLTQRHGTFNIQMMFIILVLIENSILYGVGVANLDPLVYDSIFKTVSGVLCLSCFIIGVILQLVYYRYFGHPWVNINGPSVKINKNGTVLISNYIEGGQSQWVFRSCSFSYNFEEQSDNVYIPKKHNGDASNERTD